MTYQPLPTLIPKYEQILSDLYKEFGNKRRIVKNILVSGSIASILSSSSQMAIPYGFKKSEINMHDLHRCFDTVKVPSVDMKNEQIGTFNCGQGHVLVLKDTTTKRIYYFLQSGSQ